MWHDMDPCDWLNKFYSFYMAAVIVIISRHGLNIDACHRNQPTDNKSKLVLYKPGIRFNSHLKQLYVSNKVECLSYQGGCGVRGYCMCTEAFNEELAWVTDHSCMHWHVILSYVF